jgi:hypothetical protein
MPIVVMMLLLVRGAPGCHADTVGDRHAGVNEPDPADLAMCVRSAWSRRGDTPAERAPLI